MDPKFLAYSTSDRTSTHTSTSFSSLPRTHATRPASLSASATAAASLTYTTTAPPSAPTPCPPHHHASSTVMDVDGTAVAEDRSRRAASVLSMDDIEAAQALEGLRSGMSVSAL